MRSPTIRHHDAPPRPWLVRISILTLLAMTGLLYLWDLDESGFANDYYAAAAQAGSTSWKAFLFGSLDAGNAITVDKTPLAIWPIALSVRLLGLSSFSVLMPQALEGVATVAVLFGTVRRSTGSVAAGLLAGAVLAVTPVAALIFRYDNPDAMLTLVVVGAAAATLRAVDGGRPLRWLALAGALVGMGFLAKMLEVLLVVPALVAAYVVWAPAQLGRRVAHVLVGLGSSVIAAGWWVALVQLWPASKRPWIGGSTDNSVLEVALGYNGVGRLTGNETAGASGSGWRLADAGHLFTADVAGAALWLVPAALVLGGGALASRRAEAPDRRADSALTLWLGWLVTLLMTFSLMTGIFHSYYVVLLSPAVAAAGAIGAQRLWRARDRSVGARALLGGGAVVTAVLAFALLADAPGHLALLRWVTPAALIAAGVGFLRARGGAERYLVVALALGAALAAPLSYSVTTAAEAHTGSGPHAGPGRGNGTDVVTAIPFDAARLFGLSAVRSEAGAAPGAARSGSTDLAELLHGGSSGFRWVAATGGAPFASSLELASGAPVMAVGGYKGTDPTPDLSTFVTYVDRGEVHYLVAGGRSGPAYDAISNWADHRFDRVPVVGLVVYDLTSRRR